MQNRSIAFRAWDKVLKKFHYPELWDNSMPRNWKDFYILMQFIGLKDKNGEGIYERDYLRCGDLFVEIVFRGGQFVGINKDNGYEIQNRNWLQFEVIGNAFETTLPSKFDM